MVHAFKQGRTRVLDSSITTNFCFPVTGPDFFNLMLFVHAKTYIPTGFPSSHLAFFEAMQLLRPPSGSGCDAPVRPQSLSGTPKGLKPGTPGVAQIRVGGFFCVWKKPCGLWNEKTRSFFRVCFFVVACS